MKSSFLTLVPWLLGIALANAQAESPVVIRVVRDQIGLLASQELIVYAQTLKIVSNANLLCASPPTAKTSSVLKRSGEWALIATELEQIAKRRRPLARSRLTLRDPGRPHSPHSSELRLYMGDQEIGTNDLFHDRLVGVLKKAHCGPKEPTP